MGIFFTPMGLVVSRIAVLTPAMAFVRGTSTLLRIASTGTTMAEMKSTGSSALGAGMPQDRIPINSPSTASKLTVNAVATRRDIGITREASKTTRAA